MLHGQFAPEYLVRLPGTPWSISGGTHFHVAAERLVNFSGIPTKLAKRINDLIELRLDGGISKERYNEQYAPLEERIQQLDAQLPLLEAEIDVRTIQLLSSDVLMDEVKNLYDTWADIAFDQKRAIVETITSSIEVGKEEITINLAYAPTSFRNPENSSHHLKALATK